MNKREVRVASRLSFDIEKERDIVENIDKLIAKRKLTHLIESLLRVYFDEPGKLRDKDLYNTLLETQSVGIMPSREKFFESVNKKMADMDKRIKALEDENNKMLTMIKLGEKYGINEKVKNLAASTFLVNKQLKTLERELGISRYDILYVRDKQKEFEKSAEDTLEFIIENYRGVIESLDFDDSSFKHQGEAKVDKVETKEEVNETIVYKEESKENHVNQPKVETYALNNVINTVQPVANTNIVDEQTTKKEQKQAETNLNAELEILRMRLEIEKLQAEKAKAEKEKAELEALKYNKNISSVEEKHSQESTVVDERKQPEQSNGSVNFDNADFVAMANFFGM